ncbi:(E3-independent) E2 ubiquitin-conjugating enzyme [Amphibalanus amphitrite]|uniref:(E3-independent) E2 ubiquitin-conjugating enzyme n=1 Tax=Amphibalanus amphitrite TaxID=1232801 RepID=A0A6A4VGY0_AMPAM|nr:(E3-independent) E2 ubiquitin-conjugating enzyme [Amphibalanus amphitrite]
MVRQETSQAGDASLGPYGIPTRGGGPHSTAQRLAYTATADALTNCYGSYHGSTAIARLTHIACRCDSICSTCICFICSICSANPSRLSRRKRTRRGLSLKTHVMKKRKLKRSRPCRQPTYETRSFAPGDTLVVETVKTVSWVTVVWQDGSVEEDIPSVSLHPSHHLDEHEFFPGDYVVEQKTEVGPAEYGVVQHVDHAGRTALVNWYQIYLFGSDASPQLLRQTEASVYDLSDHPDFRYRPGTVVVSVSPKNRVITDTDGEESRESGGGDGASGQPVMVKVWWANGTTSNCYPQDLFRVGEYDSDEGELWDNHDSADSTESQWETQSEESMVAGDEPNSEQAETPLNERLKPRLAAIIEKIRVTMSRLEEIFTQNSALQSPLIMRQLLDIYKNSRLVVDLCLDKLMDTTFFDESHFGGLVSQIRERSKAFAAQRESAASCRLADGGDTSGDSANQPATGASVPGGASALVECGEFCTMVKAQLLLAYEEVVRRYGISLNSTSVALESATSPAGDDSGINGDLRTEDGTEETEPASADHPKEPSTPGPTTASGDSAPHVQEFTTLPTVPDGHKFKVSLFQPVGVDSHTFMKAVRREIRLLTRSLPDGIIVKGYEERMDLYSVMITGPRRTPYEDGLFFFEVQLSPEYPRTPPVFHYISYCSDRLNPNLYEDGKVCVSLLGTWGGRGSEVWSSSSSLMQVLVSIQGLILVAEPYYNEAGYEKQRGSQQGAENSRLYNEMVILKLVQSLTAILRNAPSVFEEEVAEHMRTRAHKLIARLRHWLSVSEAATAAGGATPTTDGAAPSEFDRPDFPLLPASRGFGITLRKTLQTFEKALEECGVEDTTPANDKSTTPSTAPAAPAGASTSNPTTTDNPTS